MEQNRISTPQTTPNAQGLRSKAPAPSQAAAGQTAEDPAATGGFLSLLSALGDGAAVGDPLPADGVPFLQTVQQPDAALIAQTTSPFGTNLLGQAAPQLDTTLPAGVVIGTEAGLQVLPGISAQPQNAWFQRSDGVATLSLALDTTLPTGTILGTETSLQAWQGMTAQLQPGLSQRSDGVTTLSLAEVAQQAGLLGTELLGQGGLVAQTAKMDAAAELPAMLGQGSALSGYQRAFSRLQGVLSQGAAQSAAGTAQALGRSPELAGKQGAAALMAAPPAAAAAPDRMEAAALPARFLAEPVPTALQAQWLATAEPAARSAASLPFKESGASAHALGGSSHGVQGEPRAEGDSAVLDPAAAGAEEAATEQAAYWVSENLQNAELTVDHDGMPVEVRVSLSGNEAHVAFSSDESQTRDLLDARQDQLRDMLGNEGLVLSGVSVGDSGSRNASGDGSAPPRGRPSGRSAVQVPDDGAVARSRPSVLTDRAVDVFV